MMDFGNYELRDVQNVVPIAGEPPGTAFTCTVMLQSGASAERVPYVARQSDTEPTGQWVFQECLDQWQG